MMYPAFGGYMNFENYQFYRDNCNVINYWAIAVGIGLFVPIVAFLVAVFWWLKCQHLWMANETSSGSGLRDDRIDWVWTS
jgi:hypothetical protein